MPQLGAFLLEEQNAMARTRYADHIANKVRRDGTMSREEYQTRRTEFAPRGQELPHSKLLDIDVISIRSAAKQRDNLRKHIADNLSNDALARIYNVHVRTIEKILQRDTWSHLP